MDEALKVFESWAAGGAIEWTRRPGAATWEVAVVLLYRLKETGEYLVVPPGYEADYPLPQERIVPGPMAVKDANTLEFPGGRIRNLEALDFAGTMGLAYWEWSEWADLHGGRVKVREDFSRRMTYGPLE